MAGPFKMKGFSGFGNSPVKHTRSRGNHMKTYGKDHTNEDHPNYWKKIDLSQFLGFHPSKDLHNFIQDQKKKQAEIDAEIAAGTTEKKTEKK